jgi:hypothetical protein
MNDTRDKTLFTYDFSDFPHGADPGVLFDEIRAATGVVADIGIQGTTVYISIPGGSVTKDQVDALVAAHAGPQIEGKTVVVALAISAGVTPILNMWTYVGGVTTVVPYPNGRIAIDGIVMTDGVSMSVRLVGGDGAQYGRSAFTTAGEELFTVDCVDFKPHVTSYFVEAMHDDSSPIGPNAYLKAVTLNIYE